MPVGNSITNGYPYEPGFRDDLYQQLNDTGLDFEFVGPDGSAPYNGLFLSGAKIEQFYEGAAKDIKAAINNYRPNMLLIHLGTNNYTDQAAPYSDDNGITLNTNTSSGKLAQVLKLASAFSSVERILVCKIISQQDNGTLENPQVVSFNSEIENMFFDRAAGLAVDKMTIVDMYSKLELADYSEVRHPNESGYEKMADEFARVIKGINAGDTIDPGTVTWVRGEVLNNQTGTIQLQWRAPGDDNYTGRANLYELRYSEFDLQEFNDGILVPGVDGPSDPNSIESVVVSGLVSDVTYHFYIRCWDELNNEGPISEVFNLYIEPEVVPEYTDDFSDETLTNTWWDYDGSYDVINGQLVNVNSVGGWNDLATYKRVTYSPNADYVETTFEYGMAGDIGVAMMLDDSTATANGYFIFIRSNRLRLYPITNGSIQQAELYSVSTSIVPSAGDRLVVQGYPNSSTGHSFEVYLNSTTSGTIYIGNVHDTNKTQGNADQLYSGVMLYGGKDYAVDNFTLKIPQLPAHEMRTYAGNNESGRVTKKLANSLTVQILDINGLPVSGEPVEFKVTAGVGYLSTHSDSIEQEFNNNVWVEAESGTLDLPMTQQDDIEASDNKYIVVIPYVDEYGQGNNEQGTASYNVYIPVSGTYKVWLRVYAPSGVSNSCYVSVNNSQEYRWDFNARDYWQWVSYEDRNTFSLPSGFVDFVIHNRESGTQIDKILLTRNESYTPTNEGEETQPFSFITNASGLARTEITFGLQAGAVQVQADANVSVGSSQLFSVYAEALDPQGIDYNSAPSYPGVAGSPLDIDFSIFLQDVYSNPCVGIPVDFKVISGDGTFNGSGLDSTRLSTESDGTASIQLTLGYAEESVVQASLPGYPNIAPITFRGIAGEGVPVEIQVVEGADQTGTVMHALNSPLTVKILDEKGDPVENYPVPFNVSKGNGFFEDNGSSKTVNTSADGTASVNYTLGDSAGVNTNEVMVDVNLPGAPLYFRPEAKPDSPYQLIMLEGDEQEQNAGKQFGDSLTVKIADQYNNGIESYTVRFSVINGDGNFDGKEGISVENDIKTVTTDTLGKALTTFAAGNAEGETLVKVEGIPALQISSPDTFHLTVLPRRPNKIIKISGDTPNQSAVVNTILPNPFKVKIVDPFGTNMSSGIRVVFKTISGGGSFSSLDSTIVNSSADGTAEATYRLGTVAGTQTIRVYLPDYPGVTAIQYTATATPAPASNMIIASTSPFTFGAGHSPVSLQVRVTDEYDNPYPGHSVKFQVTQGNGLFPDKTSPVTAITNSQGVAQVDYQMGTNVNITNLITATANRNNSQTALAGSPVTFRGFVIPDSASQVVKISGDSPVQQAQIGSMLDDSLVVEVRDQYNNPIPEQAVIYNVLSTGGQIGSETELTRFTDENGQAHVFYTLGFTAGTNSDSIEVTIENRPDIDPVVFRATATSGTPEKIKANKDSLWNNLILSNNATTLTPEIKVLDIRNNPVPNTSVKFKVIDGNGTVNGADSITVTSGADGIAKVNWVLSTDPDTNIVEASAKHNGTFLLNSPVEFKAITIPGEPFYLKQISAATDTGIANQRLSQAIKVQVTDRHNYPIIGHPVSFTVTYPNNGSKGKFILDDDSLVEETTQQTNNDGIAQVYFKPVLDINTVKASSENNGSSLQSEQTFFIFGSTPEATEIRLLTTQDTTLTVADTFAVNVGAYDLDGDPVDKHNVNYKVIKGGGRLESTTIDKSFQGTLNGVATENWILGTDINTENWLEISSSNDDVHLAGSPDTVKVTLRASAPFADSTQINATQDVVADGVESSQVTIRLRDKYNNPVSGKMVELNAEDQGVTIINPTTATNGNGETTGQVKSIIADSVTVNVVLAENSKVLGSIDISFVPDDASQIDAIAGTDQTGNKGAVLSKPFGAHVTDLNGNPIKNVDIVFQTQVGDGYHKESGLQSYTTKSDSAGNAYASWVLGPNTGTQLVLAYIKSLGQSSQVAEFSITSRDAVPPYKLTDYTGEFSGTVGEEMENPIRIKVYDSDSLAVAGASVTFTKSVDDAELGGDNPATSNFLGCSEIYYTPGMISGPQQIKANVTNDETSIWITVTAQSDSAVDLIAQSATTVSDTVGMVIADTLIIKALDKHDNPVPGTEIVFNIADAPADEHHAEFLNADTLLTDSNGLAKGILKLGQIVGEYTITVKSPDLDEIQLIFNIQAVHGRPSRLNMVSGNNQVMTKNRFLVYPNIVKLTDSYGNIVSDELVYFQPKDFIGSVSSTKDTTDSMGLASCFWQLGDQAENVLWASKPGTNPDFLEFTATGVNNAFPVFTNLTHKDSVDYTEGQYQYQIIASDDDNDPLTFSVKNLPANSSFDPLTGVFTWMPKANQKKTWDIVFEVYDIKPVSEQGFDIDSLTIVVTGNSAPQIVYKDPPQSVLDVPQGGSQKFTILAKDDDSDPLTFTWYLDDTEVGTGSEFLFVAAEHPGSYSLKCVVSDGEYTDEVTWGQVTKVELQSFSAIHEPYKGVILDWETANEVDNLGFFIYRSLTKEGEYAQLNNKLIPTRKDGQYSYSDTTTVPGRTYYYKLVDMSVSGWSGEHGPVSLETAFPKTFQVHQNFPNPFNPVTRIRFDLPKVMQTRIEIFNVMGQQVATLVNNKMDPGYHEIEWNGRNDQGTIVSSGVYYYRIMAGEYKEIKKMAFVK